MQNNSGNDYQKYGKHYSDDSFWSKLGEVGRKIPFLRDALAMYFCMMDEATPVWVKGLIVGALGYFIFPLDAVPDFILVAGYLDDASVIAAAIAVIRIYIKPEHWQQADDLLSSFR
ncbi:MAG: hypothetical protein AMXMBFR48_25030 [Ignavibacteriales bacterium]